MAEFVVESGDVGPDHVGHREPAQGREDEAAEVAAVLPRCAVLETDGDVLLVEPLGEVGDAQRMAMASPVVGRVLTALDRR